METIELTKKGHDDVVAYACGKCGTVAATATHADRCCVPHTCSVCGGPTERSWLKCRECRDKESTAKDQQLYDAATKVPLSDYDHEYVCLHPYGDETSYRLVDDVVTDNEEAPDDAEHVDWAWACSVLPWPRLNAQDMMEAALEDEHPEDAIEWLDIDELQKLLDHWMDAQPQGQFYIVDTSRIVLFPDAVDPVTPTETADPEPQPSESDGAS